MYHSFLIRAGRSSSWVLENWRKGLRREGREPGRLASSTLSSSSVEVGLLEVGVRGSGAVGALGCEMLF